MHRLASAVPPIIGISCCVATIWGCSAPGDPASVVAAAAERLSLDVCEREGVEEPLLCGAIDVPVDRSDPGVTLTVSFVVVPALDGNPAGHAMVEHQGGPGSPTLRIAGQFARGGPLEQFRRNRDVLLIDQRGVGESGALICEALAERRIFEPYFTRDRVEGCRQEMVENGIDLSQYSTIAAVDDVEAIRAELGYRRLDLTGWSYGSKFMLTYAHRYPDRVRTISVFVPTIADYRRPLDWARFTQAALEGMFDDCMTEAACAAAFPDLEGDFRRLVAALEQQPVATNYVHPTTGVRVEAVIDHARLVDEIHYALLRVPRLQQLPWLIHEAASGNFAPFVDYVVTQAVGDEPPAEAMYLSVVCPEEVARIRPEDAMESVETFVGSHFVDEFRMACDVWGLPPHPDYPLAWQTLDIPAIIVAGDRDPITPVEYGEVIAAGFRQALLLPIHRMPHHSGGMDGSDCLDEVMLHFLETADADVVDTSCVADIEAYPFFTGPPEG